MTKISAPSPTIPGDERAVRDVIARCEAAWNAGDGTAFAAVMHDDVDFVGILGERYHGKEIVESGHRHILTTIYKDSKACYSVERVRLLKPDVAVAVIHEKITSHLPQAVVASTARQRQMSPDMHDSEQRATLTLLKHAGQWKIVAFHNTCVASVVTGHT
jgi:uncharacterized protein (TIGR02246 family)